MMNDAQQLPARSSYAPDSFAPLLSALIFGYYGFIAGLSTHGANGEPIALWIAFLWVLRAATILYVICTVLAWRRRPGAELAYGLCGLGATAGLAVIFVWDLISPDSTAVLPLLMAVLLVWNAYSSIGTMREGLARA